MNYYLLKSDPDTYSLDDLEKDGKTTWDGVHNFQAIAFIKKMKVGDKAYIYHSQKEKAIVGLAKVISAPVENKQDKRPSWVVDIEFVKRYKTPVTLAEIKEQKSFSDFLLIRNGRLSVMEVPRKIADWLEKKLK